MGDKGKKRTERQALARDRQVRALELRKAGWDYATIAEQLGYSSGSGAHKAVCAGLRAALREPAQELIELEVERLDAMLRTSLWQRAMNGDSHAVDRVLRIMERRSKLLGLDAPTKQELSGPHGTPVVPAGLAGDLAARFDALVQAAAERLAAQDATGS